MAMSVDGLVSGLSTTDMVNQLMQVEAMPQTALKNKVSAQNKAVTAYQDINTKLAALTKARQGARVRRPVDAVKASTSSDAAIVTTTSSASTGSLSFKVEQLATTHT
jgi:flagellar hook-associated protein 2